RFALSNDALNTYGTRARRAISTSRPARSVACASLSMTHGPAMRTNGLPPPKVMASSLTGVTPSIVSSDRLGRTPRAVPGVRILVRGRRFDERGEERMRPRRLRLELRVELHGEVPRVARQFGDLDELAVRRASGDAHPLLVERFLVHAVELVAVAVPLVDQRRAVHFLRERSRRQLAGVRAEAHRPAEIVDAEEIAQLVDHFCARIRVDFGGVGVGEPRDVARVLDGRPLEAVTDAEVGDLPLARDLRRLHHPARAAVAEAAGHEDAVRAVEQAIAAGLFERFGFDPLDVDLHAVREAAVVERLVQALVRIFVADVLADDVNRQL